MDISDDDKLLRSDKAIDLESTDTSNEPLINLKIENVPIEPERNVVQPASNDSPTPAVSPTPTESTPDQRTSSATMANMNHNHANIIQDGKEAATNKKKEDEKLNIYKALAIKLKKELVKSRDELQQIREESQKKNHQLQERVKILENDLDSERINSTNTINTLDAKVKNLKQQLQISETDLQMVQSDFENYKIKASQIMQQNTFMQSNSNKTFEEEHYKQLKLLNDEQRKVISNLESQLKVSLESSKELARELRIFQDRLKSVQEKADQIRIFEDKYETLSRENENLKIALKQFRTKLKSEPTVSSSNTLQSCGESQENSANKTAITPSSASDNVYKKTLEGDISGQDSNKRLDKLDFTRHSNAIDDGPDDNPARLSPGASIKDESQTNSSSSFDGSTSGYVHIKPAAFEIISRSSLLEDAQNQIDNLTKAYLDSENTNALLSDQVSALKEEIRRMQRGAERMDLAENLEYLKNIVFKFLSLDSGQIEQKQRLVPVLSTVLKLSPEETGKLNSLTMVDKVSMAGSFFKL